MAASRREQTRRRSRGEPTADAPPARQPRRTRSARRCCNSSAKPICGRPSAIRPRTSWRTKKSCRTRTFCSAAISRRRARRSSRVSLGALHPGAADRRAEGRSLRSAAAQSAGAVADVAGESAARPRDGEPDLAGSLRRGDRAHAQRFRPPGRAADASGTARLAGDGVRRARLEHQADAPADHAVEHLPRVERGRTRRASKVIPENRFLSRMNRASAGRRCHARHTSWPSPAR